MGRLPVRGPMRLLRSLFLIMMTRVTIAVLDGGMEVDLLRLFWTAEQIKVQ